MTDTLERVDRLELDSRRGALRFQVKVKLRAATSRVVGVREGVLEVAVAAPPVDGKANAELIRVLSRHLGIARSAVSIVGGQTSRHKRIEVSGIAADELTAKVHDSR